MVPVSVLERAAKEGLTASAYRVLLIVLRQSFGWRREHTLSWCGTRRIATTLGMARGQVQRALSELERLGFVERVGTAYNGAVEWAPVVGATPVSPLNGLTGESGGGLTGESPQEGEIQEERKKKGEGIARVRALPPPPVRLQEFSNKTAQLLVDFPMERHELLELMAEQMPEWADCIEHEQQEQTDA